MSQLKIEKCAIDVWKLPMDIRKLQCMIIENDLQIEINIQKKVFMQTPYSYRCNQKGMMNITEK